MKTCTKCKVPQNLDQFRKDSSRKDGHHPHCRTCYNTSRTKYYDNNTIREKAIAIKSYHKNKNKHKVRRKVYNWRHSYGINLTIEEYNNLLVVQDNKCAICFIPASEFKRLLAVDHCHTTGKIRGLLCFECNVGLGGFKDDLIRLQSAINYLKL